MVELIIMSTIVITIAIHAIDIIKDIKQGNVNFKYKRNEDR